MEFSHYVEYGVNLNICNMQMTQLRSIASLDKHPEGTILAP